LERGVKNTECRGLTTDTPSLKLRRAGDGEKILDAGCSILVTITGVFNRRVSGERISNIEQGTRNKEQGTRNDKLGAGGKKVRSLDFGKSRAVI